MPIHTSIVSILFFIYMRRSTLKLHRGAKNIASIRLFHLSPFKYYIAYFDRILIDINELIHFSQVG